MYILKFLLLPKAYKKAVLISLDSIYKTFIEQKYPEVINKNTIDNKDNKC